MDAERNELTWSAHPARERIRSSLLAAAVILSVSLIIYISFRSVGWSLLSFTLLIASLNRFFFPSRYTIDPEGITARYPLRSLRYSWKHIRRFQHDRNGGYLSTRRSPSRFDAYRGMHILFGDEPEVVIRRIRENIRGERCR